MSENPERRLVRPIGLRQAVVDPPRGLNREGVQRGRQVGGSEQHTSRGKCAAEHGLNNAVELRRVRRREGLLDLPFSQKFAEVVRDKSRAVV